jgi:hypothetical protein
LSPRATSLEPYARFVRRPEVSSPAGLIPARLEETMTDSQMSALDLQRQRAAKNQSLFREVNERIEDLSANASFTTFICECMDEMCDQKVALTVEEYEHIRSDSNSFFVVRGHEVKEVERTVETSDRFIVVAKLGAGERVAEALDPRKRDAR